MGMPSNFESFLHLDDFLRLLQTVFQTRHLALKHFVLRNERILSFRTTALGQARCRTATVLPPQIAPNTTLRGAKER